MRGITRGIATLIGAAAAGALVWGATRIDAGTIGGYWAVVGLLAAGGLVLALSQLAGGWTKWGWPRVSPGVFLIGFLPSLVAAGWVILDQQPEANWFQRHIDSWSGTVGIDGLVHQLGQGVGVLTFGLGLVLGFVLDTTGPRKPAQPAEQADEATARRPAPMPARIHAARTGRAARDRRREPVRAR